MLTRRRLLQSGLTTAAAVSFGPAFWRDAFAAPPSTLGAGPYGPLLPPDANGIMLPARFTSRMIAKARTPVAATGYALPDYPDGSATFPTPDGGWILAVNSEVAGGGGASGIRFDRAGQITSAYRILRGTSFNCAGGPTPWGAWLSCEEVPRGQVWECDVTTEAPVARPAMGVFQHEAACVDPVHQHVYLSEDVDGGGLYRFRPTVYPDLSAGTLEIASTPGPDGKVVWNAIPDPTFLGVVALRDQVPASIKFRRGEGIWFDSGRVYLATTTDETIHVYDTNAGTLEVLYRAANLPGTPLKGVDNVHVTKSGDLLIAEDSYDNDPDAMDICLITQGNEVSRFLKLTGSGHFLPVQSETVGIAFDPSGNRMYVGSQRFEQWGAIYEISGPFRADQATIYTPPPVPPPPAPPAPLPPAPGVPIGLDLAKRLSFAAFIRKGLALSLTLDQPAKVTVRIRAKVGRKTVTLATLTKTAKRGSSTLRIKPTKARAKTLRARKGSLKATVEVRITTTGTPTRLIKRTVTLRQ